MRPFYVILIFWHFLTIPLLVASFQIHDEVNRVNAIESAVLTEILFVGLSIGTAVFIKFFESVNAKNANVKEAGQVNKS